jgi:VIT1/CCC1 family predicted Fe2+/Mn2+ transporter
MTLMTSSDMAALQAGYARMMRPPGVQISQGMPDFPSGHPRRAEVGVGAGARSVDEASSESHRLPAAMTLVQDRTTAASPFLRTYIRDLVYGANDGIITTFAVVAGVAGAALSARIVLVLGIANLVADGISMGASNYLGIRSERATERSHGAVVDTTPPIAHGLLTFGAFVVAGAFPLVAYVLPIPTEHRFLAACLLTFTTQFVVGAARTFVTGQGWFVSGLEMLAVGAAAAGCAYWLGRMVSNVGTL